MAGHSTYFCLTQNPQVFHRVAGSGPSSSVRWGNLQVCVDPVFTGYLVQQIVYGHRSDTVFVVVP